MRRFFSIFIAVIMLVSLAACGSKTEQTAAQETAAPAESAVPEVKETAEPAAAETEEAEAAEEPVYEIEAAGLTLKYPEKWKDRVAVNAAGDKVSFSCGDTPLFDLTFNTDEGFVLGTVCGDEYTVIRVSDYSFESDDQELYAMQEDMNVILQHLMEDYDFAVGEALEKEDTSTIDIVTPVVTMKYPAKWQDKVQTEVSDEGVKFSNNGTPLFDLMFKECDGYLLGSYNGTPIYIVDYDISGDEQAAMQEDVNVILQYLLEDSNFVIS